jgi:hypothetical protein
MTELTDLTLTGIRDGVAGAIYRDRGATPSTLPWPRRRRR